MNKIYNRGIGNNLAVGYHCTKPKENLCYLLKMRVNKTLNYTGKTSLNVLLFILVIKNGYINNKIYFKTSY